ncbi:MAG TPA: ABC transporter permease [Tepidisphaeraceae bacterium]|nr:ABC transporter permease [Tepidisphaeraceae bacterium]
MTQQALPIQSPEIDRPRGGWGAVARRLLVQPEMVTIVLFVLVFAASAATSDAFLDYRFLLNSTSLYMEVGLLALAMTFVIISGNIDLSVGSGTALVAVASSLAFAAGVPMPMVIPLALLMGVALGLFNAAMVTLLRLPSLTVTLGTLALYQGIAQVLLGDRSQGGFPRWFTGINYRGVGPVPMPLVIFLIAAAILGVVLARTVFGRRVYAIGTNEAAARYSGIPVNRVKVLVFALSGLMMGAAALMLNSRLTVARYNNLPAAELAAITAVVLGGTDIFGGRGTIFGTVVALLLLGIVKKGMGLQNVSPEYQLTVNGGLLIVAVILTNLMGRVRKR